MSSSTSPESRIDPFADLTRKTVWQARLARWRDTLLRPWQPDRIDPDRSGPANLLTIGIDIQIGEHPG